MERPRKPSDLEIAVNEYKADSFIEGCYDQIRKIHERHQVKFVMKGKELTRMFPKESESQIALIYKTMDEYIKATYPEVIYDFDKDDKYDTHI